MRIAVITRNRNSWVYKLAWELGATPNELLIVNQCRPREPSPWRTRRFLRRRGLISFLDLWLQSVAAKFAALKMRNPASGPDPQLTTFNESDPPAYKEALACMRSRIDSGERRPEWWDTDSVNSKEFVERLKKWNPELVLLCGAPIIRRRFFAEFSAVINPHCGIVPGYKGSSPMQWAVYRREFSKIGYTIHLATPEVDGGPVLLQEQAWLRRSWNLTDLDWYLVYSMYARLEDLIKSGEILTLIACAQPQLGEGNTWPPMGLIRSLIASRRLRKHLSQSGGHAC